MFELFNAYEIANNEKNPFIKYIYIAHLRFILKNTFFKKYKKLIKMNMTIDINLINEFIQFYRCTNSEVKINENYLFINNIYTNNTIEIINKDRSKITINFYNNSSFTLSIEEASLFKIYSSSYNDKYTKETTQMLNNILLPAIYNYCVSYIYGEKSNLYISGEIL